MKECSIFSGGEINNYSELEIYPDNYIISADGGYYHALKLGLKTNVIIGDFDSFKDDFPDDAEVITYRAEKDDTDTMLAVKYALNNGFKKIIIYGALGGKRFDHAFANIQTLHYIKEHNADAVIYGENERIFIIKDEKKRFSVKRNEYVSVFSISDRSEGVYTNNLKYKLDNAILSSSFPLGISNEVVDDNFCEIEVKKGVLLVVIQKK